MISQQYNWKYRIYRNGSKLSASFDDIVPESVNVDIRADMYYPYTKQRTPFQQVRLVQYYPDKELREFIKSLIPARSTHFRIWNKFKSGIIQGWMPDKIHVVGASSGYDSRLIAKAIREIADERGDAWLGQTVFVECGGEGKNFEKIMKILGWKNYQIWEPIYDFEYFKDIHERFNGLCAYPVNQWYDEYIKHWKQEDIQYISGYGGNVSDAMRITSPYLLEKHRKKRMTIHQRLNYYFQHQYYYQISAFKEPIHSLHPFWSWQYIAAVAGTEHRGVRTSVWLAGLHVPECSHIRRMTILGDVAGAGYRTVQAKELKKMYEWFKSTQYGKRSNIKPNPSIEYNRWWLGYCIASYCEKNNINVC